MAESNGERQPSLSKISGELKLQKALYKQAQAANQRGRSCSKKM